MLRAKGACAMSLRRLAVLYGLLLAAFFGLLCRLYVLAQNTAYAQKAQAQTVTTLPLPVQRGDFYDCRGERLTGRQSVWYALCTPGAENYALLFDYADASGQAELYRRRSAAAPFLLRVDRDLTDAGICTVAAEQRYSPWQMCAHLIGYVDSSGHGVSGLEAAFDEQLTGSGAQSYLQCVTNAQGRLMGDTAPKLYAADSGSRSVMLTIDARVQAACEGIAADALSTGCILVLDTQTAKVRASVSMPDYDPDDVGKSIAAQDTSLVDRVMNAYNVGSVFKPVLAAAALEEGQSSLTIECVGYTEVGGHIYRCAGGVPHGSVDLEAALCKSCNCYFIAMGRALGPRTLYRWAEAFGFGAPDYLAGGMKASAGNLPDAGTLEDSGQLSNFSFGQGELLATPVQVAGMMNTIACGGVYRTPSFLEETFDASGSAENLYRPQERRVLREQTAETLRAMLVQVVENGLGREAKPEEGSAGGKTGTAQTGRFDAAGSEYKDLWFAGFYPAGAPRWTIVVMQDDQTRAKVSSAAVFARVCSALALLEND